MSVESAPSEDEGRLLLPVLVVGLAIAAIAVLVGVVIRLVKGRSTHVVMKVTIDRPPSEVFDFVSDARNVLDWLPAAMEREKVTPGPIGVGTRFEAADKIGGRRVEHTQEIIEYEPGHAVTSRISAPWNATYRIQTDTVDEGTLLSIDVESRASGLMGAFDIVPDTIIRRTFEADYRRLKDHLEKPESELAAIAIEPEAQNVEVEAEPAGAG